MRLSRVLAAGMAVVALLVASVGPTYGGPPTVDPQIKLVDSDGFQPIAEKVTPEGAVIDTFSDGTTMVKTIGTPGSSITIKRDKGAAGEEKVLVGLATTRPKQLADVDRYKNSGRTVVDDLVALGMPRADAIAQFGDMETMDGTNPYTASGASTQVASTEPLPPLDLRAGSAPSATTPYDTQCASLSYEGGKIEGYGCSTIYWVSASGPDWFFNNKFKLSARSNDTSWWKPWRLFQVGWSLQWSTGNQLFDWEPASQINRSNCNSLSLSLAAFGFSIGVSAPVCPTRIDPWRLTTRENGAIWSGFEQGTAWEAAIGVQAIKNLGEAQVSYNSWYVLSWHNP
jgi:hypothetical protein